MKLFIKTFGCQMNEYDSEKLALLLHDSLSCQLVECAEEADILILNTCSIREKAQEKVFSDLGRWRNLKQKNPELIIGVGGCVASQEGKAILQRAPYVDLIFGPQTLHRVPEMVAECLRFRLPVVDVSFPALEKFSAFPAARATGASAFVSIMEGCSKFCSFCVVPYTRGEELSRPVADILQEANTLVEQGVKEIHLLGQNVNAYHAIWQDRLTVDLALLIRLLAQIDGLLRIRFTTSHPVAFSDSLIEVYGQVPQLVNHLHLPVQSGSDRILSLMKRGHTIAKYEEKIARLREIRPSLALSSDFIIGFPGETEQDFQATMDLVKRLQFDNSFSFLYSPRPGTPAALMDDNIPITEKRQRLKMIQALLQQQADQHAEKWLGQSADCLVIGPSKRHPTELSARLEDNRIVNFSGPQELIGHMVSIQISDRRVNSLRGRWQAVA